MGVGPFLLQASLKYPGGSWWMVRTAHGKHGQGFVNLSAVYVSQVLHRAGALNGDAWVWKMLISEENLRVQNTQQGSSGLEDWGFMGNFKWSCEV